MKCWHCTRELEEQKPLPFKVVCSYCDAYLHCCRNCKYYKPGMPNECMIPGTEFVADREKVNYCEEFFWTPGNESKPKDPSEAARQLFGDDSETNKRDFDSLFK